MLTRLRTTGLPSVLLVSLLACAGGSEAVRPPTPTDLATSLTYVDPTGVPATSYSLKKRTESGGHVVLELHGPEAAVKGSGVALTLALDPAKATWSEVPVIAGDRFTANASGAPVLKYKRSGTTSGTLQVVLVERGTASAKDLKGPLLQLALDMKPNQPIGSSIALTAVPDQSRAIHLGHTDPVPLDLSIGVLATR